ncbi:radical SAM protein [Clostridium sp. 'deep sea']|uniref:SPL family radical SAM protein n=1 Tax=Clostridium sp. 'deep sea' TaxID=2779445 RepID=UPI0018969826|nr:radical SAM protein [Clostridium sp. 'deep sea']QOR33736.1 radical SAM protein [Clostridium sp. 'deep sea']
MIHEVKVKGLLHRTKDPQSWYDVYYNFNIYRGCSHACIYCDSRSKCYGIENFNDVVVKINSPQLLKKKLVSISTKRTIGTGSMSDPYEPAEKKYKLTQSCLKLIARYGFPLNLITKSDLVLRDIDILSEINRAFCQVIFTITTTNRKMSSLIEPYAPNPQRRLLAIKELSKRGINVGVHIMPILPFINDTESNIKDIVTQSKQHGANFIIASFGLTLRDRQREYYYNQLEKIKLGLSKIYQKQYGDLYYCESIKASKLRQYFKELCKENHLIYNMADVTTYEKLKQTQLKLF